MADLKRLQYNRNEEGFNVCSSSVQHSRVRLDLIANDQNDCKTPDSFIGLRAHLYWRANVAGNIGIHSPDNGNKNLKVMGYILVR